MKKTLYHLLLPLLFLYFPLAYSELPTETIPQKQLSSWCFSPGDLQLPEYIDEHQLKECLKRANITINQIPSEESTKTILWENTLTQVYMTNTRKLRIKPKRPVSKISELKDKEILSIEKTTRKLSRLFAEQLGTEDYVKYIPIGSDSGQEGKLFYVEIIPTEKVINAEGVDLLLKIKRILYILSGGKLLNYSLNAATESKINSQAEIYLNSNDEPVVDRDRKSPSWTRIIYNKDVATSFVAETLLHILQAGGANMKSDINKNSGLGPNKEIFNQYSDADEFSTSDKKVTCTSCAFCDQKVLDKQTIYEGKLINLLYNHIPFVKNQHIMLVHKKHIERPQSLNDEEILEEYKLIDLMGKRYREVLGSEGYKVWMQSGPSSGRTVLHEHTHIISNENNDCTEWLYHVLLELTGNKNPSVSKKDVRYVRELYFPNT